MGEHDAKKPDSLMWSIGIDFLILIIVMSSICDGIPSLYQAICW